MGSRWVFKVKTNADGSIERCKACLVALGYSHKEGLDYDETFSPVVRSESVRSVIALAAMNGLSLHQMDVTTAILHGDLEEVVYMKQPEGFITQSQEHLVCQLKKVSMDSNNHLGVGIKYLTTQLKRMNRAQMIPVFTLPQQMVC